MAKLFQKQNILTTLMNVGIGGAANVAVDTIVANVDALNTINSKYIKIAKIGLGILGGSLTSNKVLRAATDGIATVGASEIVSELINAEEAAPAPAAGLPAGTIGRLRTLGNRSFMHRGVRGVPQVMGK